MNWAYNFYFREGPGIPKDAPNAVRGARNYPCADVPGKRAATPRECRSEEPYVPLGTNPWYGDPNQIPTKDKRFIWVDSYARWRITDPLLFFQRLRDEQGATAIGQAADQVGAIASAQDADVRAQILQIPATLLIERSGLRKVFVVGASLSSRLLLVVAAAVPFVLVIVRGQWRELRNVWLWASGLVIGCSMAALMLSTPRSDSRSISIVSISAAPLTN